MGTGGGGRPEAAVCAVQQSGTLCGQQDEIAGQDACWGAAGAFTLAVLIREQVAHVT